MKVFVAGGTGFVGWHLCAALDARGFSTKLLVHSRKPGNAFESVNVPVDDPDKLAEVMHSCDAVINLIGIIREFPAKLVTFQKLHVEATQALIGAAKRAGVERFIQMSALGTRAGAVSDYHKTKFAAEEMVRASSLKWTIFRPSLIYGKGDAFITMLAGQLRLAPLIPVIGDGKYRMQPVYAGVVASCFAEAITAEETVGCTYELCGGEIFTYCEFLDAIADAAGIKRAVKIHLPLQFMKSIIPLLQKVPQFPITKDQLQMLLEESICTGCNPPGFFNYTSSDFRSIIAEYLKQ